MKKEIKYWIREGDAGEYESADSLDDLNLQYRDLGTFSHWVRKGFCTSAFQGNNYVSLYCQKGGPEGATNHDLTGGEKAQVEGTFRKPNPAREKYNAYTASVNKFLRDNSVKPGCHNREKEEAEPFFSRSPCECCGNKLGGNRETYNFATEAHQVFQADICVDCVYYLAYGTLDDETMKEVNK